MADEQAPDFSGAEGQAAAKPKKPLPTPVRNLILAGLAIFVALILVWTGNLRRDAARREALGQSSIALAEALADHVLLASREPAKLQRLVEKIAAAAKYKSLTVAAADGRVVASTDRTLAGRNLDGYKDINQEPDVRTSGGDVSIRRGVYLGSNNRIGAIVILVDR